MRSQVFTWTLWDRISAGADGDPLAANLAKLVGRCCDVRLAAGVPCT